MALKITAAKRKEIEAKVYGFMNIIDKTGINTKIYQDKFKAMSDVQFEKFINSLNDDDEKHFYVEAVPYKNEPTLDDIEEAAKFVGVKLHQYVYFKHDGNEDDPIRSTERVPVGYLHVRRLQQILSKKTGYSTDTDKRNQITGQLSGESKTGRVSDEEVYSLKTVGADSTLKELFGPRADNRDKRLQMYQNIDRDGFVYYSNLQGDIRNQPTLNYLDVLLLAAGLKSDLVNPSELIVFDPSTVKSQNASNT